MAVVNYAVEITTDQTSYTNTTYGIVDGIFRWITGRPNYNGSSPYPTWEDTTDNTYAWYENWLIFDQITNPYRSIDLSIAGNYSSNSGFSFNLRNNEKFFDFLKDTPIYIGNRSIKVYTIIDDIFYTIWSGLVAPGAFDESNYNIQCTDNYKKIHKMFPPETINKANFPDSGDNVQGDVIPIVIGDVSYSKLESVTSPSTLITLGKKYVFPGQYTDAKAVPALLYDVSTSAPRIYLYTPNMSFALNDLEDKYLYVSKGGGPADLDQLYLILANSATTDDYTVVYIQDGFDYIRSSTFNQYYSYDPLSGSGFTPTEIDGYDSLYDCQYFENFLGLPDNVISFIEDGGWFKFTDVDFSNSNPSGANKIDVLLTSYLIGTDFDLEVHKDTWDGDLLGVIGVTVGRERWISIPIDIQYGTIDIVFRFVGDTKGIGTRIYKFQPSHTGSLEDTFWFSIMNMTGSHLISYSDVSKIMTDKNGLPLIYIYDKNNDVMTQISNQILSYSLDDSGSSGHPQVNLYSGKINKSGQIVNKVVIPPSFWSVDIPNESSFDYSDYTFHVLQSGHINLIAGKTRSITKNVTNFYPQFDISDRNMTTGIDMEWPDFGNKTNTYSFTLRLEFPDDQLEYDYETIYCGFDLDVASSSASENLRIMVSFDSIDAFGNVITPENTEAVEYKILYPIDQVPVSDDFHLNCLPPLYYSNGGTTEGSYTSLWPLIQDDVDGNETVFKNMLEIPESMLASMRDGRSARIVQMRVYVTSCDSDMLNGNAFNLTAKLKQAGFIGIRLVDVSSEEYYVRLKGELFDGQETSNVYNSFRLILESYDGLSTSDIDYTNLPETRSSWPVGRTITERKNSYDYLSELAKHSFTAIFTTRTGKLALKAWREWKESPVAPYPVIRDGIQSFVRTNIDKLYNDIEVHYAYNVASSKFNNSLIVTKIDEDTFPSSASNWQTYVGGVSKDTYVDAKRLWEVAETSYDTTKVRQELPVEYQDLYWFNNSNIFNGLENIGASTSDSAFKYLTNLMEWSTLQKETVTFYLPLTSENIQIELLDYGEFQDTFYGTHLGWVVGVEIDIRKKQIQLTMIFDPDVDQQVYVDNLIVEQGQLINTTTVTETGSQTDEVQDGQGRI
jgi:hypothetical protein